MGSIWGEVEGDLLTILIEPAFAGRQARMPLAYADWEGSKRMSGFGIEGLANQQL
jgi:hypothetical protein